MRTNYFDRRHGGVLLFYFLFLAAAFLTRVLLLAKAHASVDWNFLRLLGVFGWGFLYDLAAASFFSIPLVLYLILVPQKLFAWRVHKQCFQAVFSIILYVLLFVAAAEWFFWDEFGVRFNFIAVDYLVYTTEVLGNIRESYPMPLILGGLFLVSSFFFILIVRAGWLRVWLNSNSDFRGRLTTGLLFLIVPILSFLLVDNSRVPTFGNAYNQELARNGPFSMLAAFRNNELTYESFYPTLNSDQAFARLRGLLKTDNSEFLSATPSEILRQVKNDGSEKRLNVIQITVESLSAEFLGIFGNTNQLTPNLDALAKEGMSFSHFFATGNRTDRGMEALTLSIPPTPGRSIVKRPANEHLFTLGSLFKNRGYDTSFIYSGFGYFDNMNYFFGNNGYTIIDRTIVPKDQITFANVWGACDEDLYRWVSNEADRSHSSGKPFFHFVMTTSNHRPYTYPDARIDLPSKVSGRNGAVKYTDFAIGNFINQARSKPWFSKTIFVIVADHCASSAGKTDLPVKRYEIPMIIYAPGLIKPQQVTTLCSQIDYPPTLLGLLGWDYKTRFFGKDVFRIKPTDERAFIGNYQKLGYLKRDSLTILKPVRQQTSYHYQPLTGNLSAAPQDIETIQDTIAYYQTAGYLFKHQLNTSSTNQ